MEAGNDGRRGLVRVPDPTTRSGAGARTVTANSANGSTTERHVPTQEVLHLQWKHVSVETCSCAISPTHLAAKNVLYCWGNNIAGQLGISSSDEDPHPTPWLVGRDNGDFIEPL